ncbi:MAG TPA: di-heme oxidoredictase family protein [Thermoanaerobaculia bacterium]|nr:di-heme oxidoredictase family protein [Thermoanaerobaculia bacterium]
MRFRTAPLVSLATLLVVVQVFAQVDPGPRPLPANAGGPLPSVAANQPFTILDFFNRGADVFDDVEDVPGGLGPRFNGLSCAECHAHPTIGGSSPPVNPQVAAANANGATNTIPYFVLINGPVKEARFRYIPDAAGIPQTNNPDGSVHPLYTIAGRADANGCTSAVIAQPNFNAARDNNNIFFRIPTPLFGGGLIENIDDSTLLAYRAAVSNNTLGITPNFNRNGNDGTISRFGWKAQNKSLELFSGEAYNVEMGVSNELSPQERPAGLEAKTNGLPSQCRLNATPEDHTNFNQTPVDTLSDVTLFSMFMRLLKPPVQQVSGPNTVQIVNGEAIFTEVGCAKCHKVAFTTGTSSLTASLNNAEAKLFSDLAVHHMGSGLADNLQQGSAQGTQFRTAPLWGVGQRIFLLHDGRATTMMDAINAHSSSGSEANAVIANYGMLSLADKQALIYYLRSL